MRILDVILIALSTMIVTGCATTVSQDISYTLDSSDAIVIYQPVNNVDFTVKAVDLVDLKSDKEALYFPALSRAGVKVLAAEVGSVDNKSKIQFGYKLIPAGNYAIVSVLTGVFQEFKGTNTQNGNSQGCWEDDAIVLKIKAGHVNIIPRSYLRVDQYGKGTGLGEEVQILELGKRLVKEYPNISTGVSLAKPIAKIDFGPPTSNDFFTDSCASAKSFIIKE